MELSGNKVKVLINECEVIKNNIDEFVKFLKTNLKNEHSCLNELKVDIKGVCERLSVSRSTLLRMVSLSKFPQPLPKIHSKSKLYWNLECVLKYISNNIN